jgi:hypothetical protein
VVIRRARAAARLIEAAAKAPGIRAKKNELRRPTVATTILQQRTDQHGCQRFNGSDVRSYLLSGFLVCGRCGKKLTRPRCRDLLVDEHGADGLTLVGAAGDGEKEEVPPSVQVY